METILTEVVSRAVIRGRYPYTQLLVSVEVLSDDGGVLAAAINAIYISLVDSGISLDFQFCAISFTSINGGVFVDPNHEEEQKCEASVTIVVDVTSNNIISIYQMSGEMPITQLSAVVSIIPDITLRVQRLMKSQVVPS